MSTVSSAIINVYLTWDISVAQKVPDYVLSPDRSSYAGRVIRPENLELTITIEPGVPAKWTSVLMGHLMLKSGLPSRTVSTSEAFSNNPSVLQSKNSTPAWIKALIDPEIAYATKMLSGAF